MFRKFTREDFGPLKQVKASQTKHIKQSISTQYPGLPVDELFPKNIPMFTANSKIDHSTAILSNNKVYFFQQKENFNPTLQLAMTYPEMMKQVQVDKGAIKHVLSGSNIMAPGLTSAGGKLPDDIVAGNYVLIMGEGVQSPLAIGLMKASAVDIKKQNSGVVIDLIQYAGDGIWTDCLEH
ncbi:translation machinery-associated protein, putative [Entamoeba dispar SAW760]|uniref:Translation machinery-associated protein, putative n=1 Tax=Entamoeba dispar (strain ATCC PRA-260 / SAW760) TaxID=370354 RepID=B0ENC3_ENTDS|nr:translation machinery-associated protein, putative [Entamoeba dispar SAW760]EDR24000.1 translation machinery-associated protein, putative [Entamoeba dispar SAW760]|eukprot:EDR24000.1 translation machinery-associated protein, putative [Entamoeba dispar SAW760]